VENLPRMRASPKSPPTIPLLNRGRGICLLAIAVAGVGLASIRYFNKISVCSRLKPGITLSEMTARFGNPIVDRSNESGRWVYFRSTIGAAGPIRAKLDDKENVIVLQCDEDSQPVWSIE